MREETADESSSLLPDFTSAVPNHPRPPTSKNLGVEADYFTQSNINIDVSFDDNPLSPQEMPRRYHRRTNTEIGTLAYENAPTQ